MLEQHTLDVMGGPDVLGKPIHNQLDLADLIMYGLPRQAAQAVRSRLNLTEQEFAHSLGCQSCDEHRCCVVTDRGELGWLPGAV